MKKIIMNLLVILFCLNAVGQNKQELKIIEKPIVYNKERVKLSIEYLKIRYGIVQNKPKIIPKIIVLHYTDGGSILSNFNYFNHVEIENERKISKYPRRLGKVRTFASPIYLAGICNSSISKNVFTH